MGRLRRFLERLSQTDEERLDEEVRTWAATVPGTTRIAEAPSRKPARVAGVVKRITIRPMDGAESLEAVVTDGTGEITVLWTGRRSIPGLSLGTRVTVEGMIGERSGGRRMVNPRFEFAA